MNLVPAYQRASSWSQHFQASAENSLYAKYLMRRN